MNFTSLNFPESSALDQPYTKGTKKFKSPNSTFPFVEIETSLDPVITQTTSSPCFAYSVLLDAERKREKTFLGGGFYSGTLRPEDFARPVFLVT